MGLRMIHASLLFLILSAGCLTSAAAADQGFRCLPVKVYRDKMKAGWIGQIIGVSWGAPTEGKYDRIMPADKMPPFSEDLVNHAFNQDDLYVEKTFLRSMEQHGLDVSIRQAGSGRILAAIQALERNRPDAILLRLRHPQTKNTIGHCKRPELDRFRQTEGVGAHPEAD